MPSMRLSRAPPTDGVAPEVKVDVRPSGRRQGAHRGQRQWPGAFARNARAPVRTVRHQQARRHRLGLAIAQRIVIEHGGEIDYSESPGGGATFTVELPVAGPSFLQEAPASEE